ncbi:MAG: hypothetical protein BJ554DRAFT_3720 [Olpidium bornovanus]|uniref:Lupus La protein n=1 Tax=Olpidium bornovanus TaxID=278681 RepID=A0A8H8DFC0_9FUNG|nr:MAG: hypothetical protein BJ554DRAFT_3720 [Olpidium bornovanus]
MLAEDIPQEAVIADQALAGKAQPGEVIETAADLMDMSGGEAQKADEGNGKTPGETDQVEKGPGSENDASGGEVKSVDGREGNSPAELNQGKKSAGGEEIPKVESIPAVQSEKYKGPPGPVVPGPSTVPADPAKRKRMILRQVEFYLGVNLAKDEFLFNQYEADPEHWIPIDLICTFKRMRRWTERAEIVEALRESPSLLEVNEDNSKVRRKTPLVQTFGGMERSVYVETESLQDELDDFFPKFGEVNEVRFRRTEGKVFKGSVFVEFSTMDGMTMLLNQKDLEFNGHKLTVMAKEDYCNMKMKEKGITKENRNAGNFNRPFNAFRLLRQRELDAGKGGNGRKQKSRKPDAAPTPSYVPGCLVRFTCPAGAGVTWSAIKSALRRDGYQVRFISFDEGSETTGVCQLQSPEVNKLLEQFKDSGATIESEKVEFTEFEEGFEDLWYKKRNLTAKRGQSGKRGGRGHGPKRGRGRGCGRRNEAEAVDNVPALTDANADDSVNTAVEGAVSNGKRKVEADAEKQPDAKKAKGE